MGENINWGCRLVNSETSLKSTRTNPSQDAQNHAAPKQSHSSARLFAHLLHDAHAPRPVVAAARQHGVEGGGAEADAGSLKPGGSTPSLLPGPHNSMQKNCHLGFLEVWGQSWMSSVVPSPRAGSTDCEISEAEGHDADLNSEGKIRRASQKARAHALLAPDPTSQGA